MPSARGSGDSRRGPHRAVGGTIAAEAGRFGRGVCDHARVRNVRRLPWLIALPLMLGGSFTAHAVGSRLIPQPVSADADGGHEFFARVDHSAVTLLPLIGELA